MKKLLLAALFSSATMLSACSSDPEPSNLGITSQQFEKRFNSFVDSLNASSSELTFNRLKLEKKGENEKSTIYSACTYKYVCFSAQADKNTDKLVELTVITTRDGSIESGFIVMSNMIITSAAAVPTVKKMPEISSFVVEAVNNVKVDGDKKISHFGDYTFKYSRSSTIGNWLIISKKE